MLKLLLIPAIFSLFSLLGFLQTPVTLLQNVPTSANAGNEFLVEVTINKGDIEGFARFQQDLPVGFTAIPRETANGEFKFQDQKIKIQWMRVPLDREFKISYAVQIAPTISGEFAFEGKFSYIINNGVQTASTGITNIQVIADETAAGIAASAQTTYSYQNVSLKNIDCVRQKPFLNENNEIIVNILINKGDLKDFGKIQEQVPRGYNAISIKSKNSIFTYKNSIIKFLWMNMPPESQFTVSYKLVPEGTIPDDQAFIISGTFSYAESERTKTINIAERNVDLSQFSGDDLVAQGTPAEPEPTATVVVPAITTPITQTQTSNESLANNNYSNTNTTTVYQETQQTAPKTGNIDYSKNNVLDYVPENDGIPQPADGIRYKVQIAAGHKLVGKNYFKRLNITDQVQTEIHDGWHKYTIGNFILYKEARDYRIYVWNNTPIHDAFVAAYNNGMRITVQEALMIANQKWYK